jgi:hypothetical protein
MAKSNHARAPQSASRTSRNRRRQQGGATAWMRPWCRATRAIEASIRLINSTLRTVERTERCAHRRPVRASHTLHEASARLIDASARLVRAAQELVATNECLGRHPDETMLVPELLVHTTGRWLETMTWLREAADDVFSLHEDVLLGLETGVLVPEQPAKRRPRIILAPRPVAMRAFLRRRQPRVVDRIAPILRRRRRTPRPAYVRVPQRNLLGRAPPLFSTSLL